jgi:hypothetical protein
VRAAGHGPQAGVECSDGLPWPVPQAAGRARGQAWPIRRWATGGAGTGAGAQRAPAPLPASLRSRLLRRRAQAGGFQPGRLSPGCDQIKTQRQGVERRFVCRPRPRAGGVAAPAGAPPRAGGPRAPRARRGGAGCKLSSADVRRGGQGSMRGAWQGWMYRTQMGGLVRRLLGGHSGGVRRPGRGWVSSAGCCGARLLVRGRAGGDTNAAARGPPGPAAPWRGGPGRTRAAGNGLGAAAARSGRGWPRAARGAARGGKCCKGDRGRRRSRERMRGGGGAAAAPRG